MKLGLLVCFCAVFAGAVAQAQTIVSTTDDGRFAINGTPTFLVGLAYYDCSNYHTEDIDAAADAGWNLMACHLDDVFRNNANSLYEADGTLKPEKVTAFQNFIAYAASKGLVVDLNVLYADLDGSNSSVLLATPEARTHAVTNAISAFKHHANVFFSVINEHNYGSDYDTEDEAGALLATARAACPNCLLTYSSSDNFGPDADGTEGHLFTTRSGSTVRADQVEAELANGIDILTTHSDRQEGWNRLATARASNLREWLNSNGYQNVPLFFEEDAGEDPRVDEGPLGSAEAYIQVARDCKKASCAGWVYLTIVSFDLSTSSLVSQLGPLESEIMKTLPTAVMTTNENK